MHASFKALALLAAVASASAAKFNLKAHVASGDDLSPPIEGQLLAVDPATGFAYLTQPSGGAAFTDDDNTINTDATGSLTHIQITPGGNDTMPDTNVVSFSADAGTSAVDIEFGALQYANGAFSACPASVLQQDGDKILINYAKSSQRSLKSCASLLLFQA
ncbi:unnamed protein product [Peniophora sp. CBMAI 1063]|nr:unnamed protein product [Peniophora sp. CBMAI 1063]